MRRVNLFEVMAFHLFIVIVLLGFPGFGETKELIINAVNESSSDQHLTRKVARNLDVAGLPVPTLQELRDIQNSALPQKPKGHTHLTDPRRDENEATHRNPSENIANDNKIYRDKEQIETIQSEEPVPIESFETILNNPSMGGRKQKKDEIDTKVEDQSNAHSNLRDVDVEDKSRTAGADKVTSRIFEYIIVGAGPSGLQMAYFLQKAGRDYIVLERANHSGSFFDKYPRHDKLISINKRFTGKTNKHFNLRHDWNSLISDDEQWLFKHYSKTFFPERKDLLKYLNDFSSKNEINIQFSTEVNNINREKTSTNSDTMFTMEDQNNTAYKCRTLILATGMWKPNIPRIQGMEETLGYEEVPNNPDFFEAKNVLILGHGNSAFETAQAIYGHANVVHMLGRSRVKLAWETHYVGDVRGVNNELLDTYQLKSLDGVVEGPIDDLRFDRHGEKISVSHRTGGDADNFALRLQYDVIIRCLGWQFDRSLFNSTLLPKDSHPNHQKYLTILPDYQVSGVPGLYITGTASHFVDYRKSAGGFIHGFRYTAEALHHILEYKHHKIPWPSLDIDVTNLVTTFIKRANEASSIYQMFGILGDVVLFNRSSNLIHYIESFPLKLLPNIYNYTGFHGNHVIVMVLEYGKNFSGAGKDVFRRDRAVGMPDKAHESNFLHPVFYHYERIPTYEHMIKLPEGQVLPKPTHLHHCVEDFLASWDTPLSHILPLRRFTESSFNEDLRSQFSDDCFSLSMTYKTLPLGCESYMKGNGLDKLETGLRNTRSAV